MKRQSQLSIGLYINWVAVNNQSMLTDVLTDTWPIPLSRLPIRYVDSNNTWYCITCECLISGVPWCPQRASIPIYLKGVFFHHSVFNRMFQTIYPRNPQRLIVKKQVWKPWPWQDRKKSGVIRSKRSNNIGSRWIHSCISVVFGYNTSTNSTWILGLCEVHYFGQSQKLWIVVGTDTIKVCYTLFSYWPYFNHWLI